MSSNSRIYAFSVGLTLLLLACASVQVNVQVNAGKTETPTKVALPAELTTEPKVALTSTPISLPPTGTASPAPLPMPHLPAGQPIQITDLHMLGDTTGWGFEFWGHILHTVDGGKTWQDVTPPQESYYKKGAFSAADPNYAWAAATTSTQITTWRTEDAGQSWDAGNPIDLSTLDAGPCGPLLMGRPSIIQLAFIDAVKGWMVATAQASEHAYTVSLLFSTTDAGSTWSLKNLATRDCSSSGGPEGLMSVLFWTPNDGWGGFIQNKYGYFPYNQERFVGGWDIYRTTDAGQTWESNALPAPPGFLEEASKSEHAQDYASCGISQFIPFSSHVFALRLYCFIPPNHASGYYYLTFNNGLDWNVWESGGNEEFFVDPYSENKTTGWRFLRSNSDELNQIQQTTDRGSTWEMIKKVAWKFARFDFVDEQNGWALATIGTSSALLRTTNGGRRWSQVSPVIGP
jgi:photosystem II stability/assembly factor-like uncharacterized protein